MAGFPVRNRMLAAIEKDGGWDALIQEIADGKTWKELAARYDVSRKFLHWIATKDPERKAAIQRAYETRAEAHMDNALAIMDNAPETPAGVAKARGQVEIRQFLAGADNARFRKSQAPVVQLSVQELHLNALRKRDVTAVPLALEAELLPLVDVPSLPSADVSDTEPEDTQS